MLYLTWIIMNTFNAVAWPFLPSIKQGWPCPIATIMQAGPSILTITPSCWIWSSWDRSLTMTLKVWEYAVPIIRVIITPPRRNKALQVPLINFPPPPPFPWAFTVERQGLIQMIVKARAWCAGFIYLVLCCDCSAVYPPYITVAAFWAPCPRHSLAPDQMLSVRGVVFDTLARFPHCSPCRPSGGICCVRFWRFVF